MGSDKTYSRVLASANLVGDVGIHKHILTPQSQNSRLGFKGRKVSKKGKLELRDKMLKAAQRRPEMVAATLNMVKLTLGC